jgi:hypothetical protein
LAVYPVHEVALILRVPRTSLPKSGAGSMPFFEATAGSSLVNV